LGILGRKDKLSVNLPWEFLTLTCRNHAVEQSCLQTRVSFNVKKMLRTLPKNWNDEGNYFTSRTNRIQYANGITLFEKCMHLHKQKKSVRINDFSASRAEGHTKGEMMEITRNNFFFVFSLTRHHMCVNRIESERRYHFK
jgi:hypothetical protein